MAARLRDDGQTPSVTLVRPKAFKQVVADCNNPPKPSQALIDMFRKKKSSQPA